MSITNDPKGEEVFQVVFPDAEWKIWLDAKLAERGYKRYDISHVNLDDVPTYALELR